MSNRGKTIVCDRKDCVSGKYNETKSGSAHQRLAAAAGITPVIGRYQTSSGTIGLRSESINRTNFGTKDLSGSSAGNWMANKIASGDVMTVREYKAKK